MTISLPLLLVVIGLTSLLAQWIAWLLKLPAILPLLIFGILLGPVSGTLDPGKVFGEILFPLVSLSVAIILFEGALSLRREDLSGMKNIILRFSSVGMMATFITTSLACWFFLNVSPAIAALAGAVTVVTGPTVIAPLMRVVRPTSGVNKILRWEGIIIDPVGAIFTLLVYEFVTLQNNTDTWLHLLGTLLITLTAGMLTGGICGAFLAVSLRRGWFPHYLQNFAVLIIILTGFGVSNALAEESGLLAVTIAGIWLANARNLDTSGILAFKEDLSAILISALFIILSARLDLAALIKMGWPLLGVILIIQFIGRPLCVAAATINSGLTLREKLFLSWIAPRGIVAAAVSSLFAISLTQHGFKDANQLSTIVFAIIIGTVMLQSLTASGVARILGVKAPPPQGVLIVGAEQFGRELAVALSRLNIPVQLADDNWENCRQARMQGIEVYFGNPWSEHAENMLDLSKTAWVFALSSDRHRNALTVYHFSHIFARERVLAIHTDSDETSPGQKASRFRQKASVFSEVTWADINRALTAGGSIKSTRLSEKFGLTDYMENKPGAIPLLIIDEDGDVSPFRGPDNIPLNCTLISLFKESDE
jgi:NhaP-type Na+/H+ or K+/H+ antiporter